MKLFYRPVALALALVLPTLPALAQPRSGSAAAPESNWPCIQREVPQLAPGLVWSGPPLDDALKEWRRDPAVAKLVPQLAAQRTSMEEAKQAIAGFAAEAGAEKTTRLTRLFAGLFQRLNSERSRVVSGLEHFSERQRALAERIKKTREQIEAGGGRESEGKLAQPMLNGVAIAPGAPRFASPAQESLYWDTRIYDERRQLLSYACEVPQILEQRLFALGREIQRHLD